MSNQKVGDKTAGWPEKAADALFYALMCLLAICVLAMLLLVFCNVVLRYGFNSGITVSEEVARLSFVWLTFVGAVVALRSRQHIAINMLVQRFSPQAQKITHIVRQGVILWVLWLMIDGSWRQTVIGMDTVTSVVGMPIAVFSGAALFASVVMALMILLDLVVALRTPATRENIARFCTSVDSAEEI